MNPVLTHTVVTRSVARRANPPEDSPRSPTGDTAGTTPTLKTQTMQQPHEAVTGGELPHSKAVGKTGRFHKSTKKDQNTIRDDSENRMFDRGKKK